MDSQSNFANRPGLTANVGGERILIHVSMDLALWRWGGKQGQVIIATGLDAADFLEKYVKASRIRDGLISQIRENKSLRTAASRKRQSGLMFWRNGGQSLYDKCPQHGHEENERFRGWNDEVFGIDSEA